jgi:hypothetical protein
VAEATGLGLAAVKSEGGSILYDNPSPGATSVFTHVTYGLGYIITREAEEDNQYQEVAEGNAASLPWSMLTTKEIVHANILNRGLQQFLCRRRRPALVQRQPPDGQRHFQQHHHGGRLVGSLAGGRSVDADGGDQQRGPADRASGGSADRQSGPDLQRHSHPPERQRVGTANNDLNAIKTLGLVPEIVVNHYLTDTDAWYLQTNVPNGLISYQRRALELRDDSDFDTENHKHKATERYSAGWADPRAIFGNTGV